MKIDMIVRGICCIVPQIKGKTENISIISIVGRFLEHSRIYCFGEYEDDMKMYISSADVMTRNTERRVEIACPIYDEDAKNRIYKLIEASLSDNEKARSLKSNKKYEKIKAENEQYFNSQQFLLEQTDTSY